MKIHLTVCTFVFKCSFFLTASKSNIIDINTDNITIQKFRFYEGSAATGKLIEY